MKDPFGALLSWTCSDGAQDHCSWNGVYCSDGKVVDLYLKDLCLEGTLGPELGSLIHVKSIVLRNNSFLGIIPKEIKELDNLEVLDLGYNNFSGSLPLDVGSNLSLTILLLDNNRLLESIPTELYELWKLSEVQVDEKQLSSAALGESNSRRSFLWNMVHDGDAADRRTLEEASPPIHQPKSKKKTKNTKTNNTSSPPKHSPPRSQPPPKKSSSTKSSSWSSPTPVSSPQSPSHVSPSPSSPPLHAPSAANQPPTRHVPMPSPSGIPAYFNNANSKHPTLLIVFGAIGSAAIVSLLIVGVLLLRCNKTVIVKPWATGLSGQLQKAFITGVPKLKRSELETACEDFSNIISSSSDDTVYKGTLSSGVEIAVTSTTVTSAKDWSKHLEGAFREKIDTLSKVNHKNFVNLLGFCEEEEPFTRMMIFEYAPNGTVFEHLHIKESEHLDWRVRLRIAMGIAYCLEHMHQLNPPVVHKRLHSSTIYLTEDYAAKISEFGFWNEATMAKMRAACTDNTPSTDPENNVYTFGVILLEMLTGMLPHSLDDGPLIDWASDFLSRKRPIKDMVDPTLKSFQEDDLEKLCDVITSCINPNPAHRPKMGEVTARLREITSVTADGAKPRLSPLWWAELEVLSTSEGS